MAERGSGGKFVTGGGKTSSEPTAVPAEPGEAHVHTLLMDRDKYDYVKVEPRPAGWQGAWDGPSERRKMGFRPVPVQNRDEIDVDLLYPERTLYDSLGRSFVDPEIRETLHPGMILMAREKAVGDRARANELARNNPELPDDDAVPKQMLRGPNGVMTRINEAVDLRHAGDRLPTEAALRKQRAYEERVEKRGDVEQEYSEELDKAATETVRIAD